MEPTTCKRTDIEIIVSLPKISKGFVTSIFRGDEISEFNSDQQRLWVEILNKNLTKIQSKLKKILLWDSSS